MESGGFAPLLLGVSFSPVALASAVISKVRGAGISTSIYNIYMLYNILARSVGRVYLLVYIIDTCCIRYYQGPWGGYIYWYI